MLLDEAGDFVSQDRAEQGVEPIVRVVRVVRPVRAFRDAAIGASWDRLNDRDDGLAVREDVFRVHSLRCFAETFDVCDADDFDTATASAQL